MTDAANGGRRSAGDTGSGSETCERVPLGPNQLDEVIFKVAAYGYDAVQVVRPDNQYPFVTLLAQNMSFQVWPDGRILYVAASR